MTYIIHASKLQDGKSIEAGYESMMQASTEDARFVQKFVSWGVGRKSAKYFFRLK